MKVRWTTNSVRMRITPTELAMLQSGQTIAMQIALPGGWKALLTPNAFKTELGTQGSTLCIGLATEDVARLAAPYTEGVYFTTEGVAAIRYLVEKDFPCVHPRPGEAAELASDTFAPPPDYKARKPNQ